jgi:hypothetical protein
MSYIMQGSLQQEDRTLLRTLSRVERQRFLTIMDSACDDVSNTANSQDRFLLHSDDPCNFLKLCAALRVLVRCRLTNQDIDHAEGLIQEYCTELIPVCS